MHFNEGIIDVHVHTHGGMGTDNFIRNAVDHLSASGLDAVNLICVKHGRSACMTEADALLVKTMFPDKFSVLGNPTFRIPEFGTGPEGLANQVQDFLDAGIDGVKLGDGNTIWALGDEKHDPMFRVLEENGVPVLYHVGGFAYHPARRTWQKNPFPVENPPFLIHQPGKDDDMPSHYIPEIDQMNELKFAEVERLLARHPDLHLILPHTYFRANNLDALAHFLDAHPAVCVDMTPCSQIYYYMSQDPKKSREFLCDYRKRVLFGTDNDTESDPMQHIILMRAFFETDEVMFASKWGFDIQGILLPKEVREDIYRNNYLRLFPRRKPDPGKAAAYCEKLYEILGALCETPEPNREEVLECAKRLSAMR